MLLIYLQDFAEEHRGRLERLCRNRLLSSEWEARIACCEQRPDRVAKLLKENAVPALFVLDGQPGEEESVTALIRLLRKENPANYLVLLIGKAAEALNIRPSFYRVSGYLLRPVEEAYLGELLEEIYRDFSQSGLGDGDIFRIKIKNSEYPVSYEKILFFESDSKKIIARTAAQEYTFYDSLERIAGAAPPYFFRAHKSYCVNLKQVSQVDYTQMCIVMRDGSMAFLSRNHKQALRQKMEQWERSGVQA